MPKKNARDWFSIASAKGLIHGAMAGWNQNTDPHIRIKTTCGQLLAQAERGPGSVALLTCPRCTKALSEAGYQ